MLPSTLNAVEQHQELRAWCLALCLKLKEVALSVAGPMFCTAFRSRCLSLSGRVQSCRHLAASAKDLPKTFVQLEIEDEAGSLQDTLRLFWKRDINMTRIESRPSNSRDYTYCFHIDFEGRPGQPDTDALLKDLHTHCVSVDIMDDQAVPWFPRKKSDLDSCTHALDGGTDLINDDHPGFRG